MARTPNKLVIRPYAPTRYWVALVTALLLALVGLYAAFQVGRYTAGYDALHATGERNALQQQLTRLQQDQHGLHLQLAEAQEARVADVRERSEVARTIGQLQQQDVELYRGLVAPQAGQQADTAVRVQQFHITASPAAQKFVLRFTLNRVTPPERAVNGTLAITVDGSQGGAPGSADLATLTGGKNELAFNFRYYADIEQQVTLPTTFKPDSVTIEVRPARKGVAPYRQTFIWEVDPI